MAGELIWSRTALDDLDAIAAFIARHSAIHARLVVEQVIACGERLLVQSATGYMAPEAHLEPPDHSLYGFRLLCERQGADLHLLAIIPHYDSPHPAAAPPAPTPPGRPARTVKPLAPVSDHNNPWLTNPVRETVKEPAREPVREPVREPMRESVRARPAREPVRESAKEPAREPVQELARDTHLSALLKKLDDPDDLE